MSFSFQSNIYSFIIYSFVIICIFYITPIKFRNVVLLLSSILFYILCDYRFLGLILLETCYSYFVAIKIAQDISPKKKKGWFITVIIVTIVILCFFKYFNFFTKLSQYNPLSILMPIGISYYSFRIISYLADVYNETRLPEKLFVNYCIYVMFFPHLLSGPIVRSEMILQELNDKLIFKKNLFLEGVILIINGVFKKKVIADNISEYVNLVFSAPSSYSSLSLWLAAILYSIQLYCDFSGYSDIAIGITKLLGLDCALNFNRPYFSTNVREFWARWHISLSQWLRDYIYIPLGGNRTSKKKRFSNVMITFAVCGLWHGSQPHYLFWGIYHGIANALTPKTLSPKIISNKYSTFIKSLFCRITTFIIVMFGWIFFRANSMKDAMRYIVGMFAEIKISYTLIVQSILPFTSDYSCLSYFIMVLGMIFLLFLKEYSEEKHPKKMNQMVWMGIYMLCIILFGATGGSSFLYANY